MPDLSDPEIQNILNAYRSAEPSEATIRLIQLSIRTPAKAQLMERVVRYPGILEHSLELIKGANPGHVMMAEAFLRMLMPHGETKKIIAAYPDMLQEIRNAWRRLPFDGNQDFRRRVLKSTYGELDDAAPDNLIIRPNLRVVSAAQNEPHASGVIMLSHAIADDITHAGLSQLFPLFQEFCLHLGFRGHHRQTFGEAIEGYESAARGYHSQDHAYKLAHWTRKDIRNLCQHLEATPEETKNIQAFLTIAGLYHDGAYVQVDGGVTPALERAVQKYGCLDAGERGQGPFSFKIHAHLPETGIGKLVCDVFGFAPGQTIHAFGDKAGGKAGGLDEFLSALMAADSLLRGEAPSDSERKSIAAISAIIEMTIPFRPSTVCGDLHGRLLRTGLNRREAEAAVKAGIVLATRDVEDFCGGSFEVPRTPGERLKKLLGGSWKLMPENNQGLRGQNYVPAEYLGALRRMRGFMSGLDPANIFHSFCGFTPVEELEERIARTRHTLRLAEDYLTAKIASASIVAAVATKVDPEGRVSLHDFMNGITCKTFAAIPANDHMRDDDSVIYDVLLGRGDKMPVYGWDVSESPIAAFLVRNLGLGEVRSIAAAADEYFKEGSLPHEDFLGLMKARHPAIMHRIYTAMESIASDLAAKAEIKHQTAFSVRNGLRSMLGAG